MPYGFKMFLHAICADFLRVAICPYRTVFQDEVFKISKKVLRNYIFIETTYDIFIALPCPNRVSYDGLHLCRICLARI